MVGLEPDVPVFDEPISRLDPLSTTSRSVVAWAWAALRLLSNPKGLDHG